MTVSSIAPMGRHPILERELQRAGLAPGSAPTDEQWQGFLAALDKTLTAADQEHAAREGRFASRKRQEAAILEMSEASLRSSEERHPFLFEASPLPIWVFDPTTLRFLAVNEAMVKMIGYSRDELMTMRLTDLKPPSDIPELLTGLAVVSSGTIKHIGIRRYRRKDGGFVEVDITAHTMTMDGAIVQLAIGIDVTQARRMEELLRQSQKMDAIGQLASGVAHDFNNILAVILGNSDIAREILGEDHDASQDLREIQKAAERAASLTRQLLTFSRQQQREVKVQALNALVVNLEKMLARIVGEDIAMSAILSPQLGAIQGDGSQLEQVLLNLVVNARDAMPNGGRLSIETSNVELEDALAAQLGVSPGRFVMMAVSDTGIGMNAETRARIFEPFFTTKAVGKGTGLGLSTVFGIVKQSDGAISVYSEPGVGTTFRVYFPRCDAEDAVAPSALPNDAPHRGSATVLLVEDDEPLRNVIQRRLKAWGYSVHEARDANDALELLLTTAHPIDLVLTDLVMPGIDGRALANRILLHRPQTKILFMSGYTEHAAVKTTALSAQDHFIAKPFTGLDLATALERALALDPAHAERTAGGGGAATQRS